ncbi:hypothetical protein BRADI_3g39891v3 [Brachypodium distachyon]|uniref:Uncharacterized protein n=1 Tax=Brachypodium distachyon TaxID=15368 RepID=A0A2K2D285_BRADI|nr:hypothetical protein BRADI_3g39891v3 [Brachypodium distachyon]
MLSPPLFFPPQPLIPVSSLPSPRWPALAPLPPQSLAQRRRCPCPCQAAPPSARGHHHRRFPCPCQAAALPPGPLAHAQRRRSCPKSHAPHATCPAPPSPRLLPPRHAQRRPYSMPSAAISSPAPPATCLASAAPTPCPAPPSPRLLPQQHAQPRLSHSHPQRHQHPNQGDPELEIHTAPSFHVRQPAARAKKKKMARGGRSR